MTSDQRRVMEALAAEYGAAHSMPYMGDLIACGWDGDHRVSEWLFVYADGQCSGATRMEVAYALEASDRRNARVAEVVA